MIPWHTPVWYESHQAVWKATRKLFMAHKTLFRYIPFSYDIFLRYYLSPAPHPLSDGRVVSGWSLARWVMAGWWPDDGWVVAGGGLAGGRVANFLFATKI